MDKCLLQDLYNGYKDLYNGCIVTFCQFSWSADKFCKFAYGGKIFNLAELENSGLEIGRYCKGKIKKAPEKVSRKMVLEIKYVNANNAVIHTENSKLLLDLNCSPKELEKTVVELNRCKAGFFGPFNRVVLCGPCRSR